jgi:uncharacterized protein
MLLDLERPFAGRGAQKRVAYYLLKNGVSVGDGRLLAGDLEVSKASVARVLGVDRRVITSTIETIKSNEGLSRIFKALNVTASLRELAPVVGYGAIEIIPRNARDKGIVAAVSREISDAGIGIRQIIADDPMFDNPEMTLITDKPIPRELIDRILKVESVKKVVVLN